MTEVKERLDRSFLQALKNPELFRKYGKTVGGGLILYGPPGCGKTWLARALAGELQARFLNVGLSDVLDFYFGESERKLHELFDNARRLAPVVVFFDEVDALGLKRSKMSGNLGRNLVNQFLAEMDGVASRNEGLFFLGATNHPWDVDTALRRPGRFDRMLVVSPPDPQARHKLLQLSLEGKPVAPEIDLAPIARATEGFSGADMVALVSEALELAIAASLNSGREVPVDASLLQQALRSCRASTRAWFDTARNYAIYANEGGTFDDMLAYMKQRGIA
ncbi:MAG: ATP-binding protein [Alphaproteobacteria bacterium]|nr:ATP-binding protein [Alphaproteobacteria bacterium]